MSKATLPENDPVLEWVYGTRPGEASASTANAICAPTHRSVDDRRWPAILSKDRLGFVNASQKTVAHSMRVRDNGNFGDGLESSDPTTASRNRRDLPVDRLIHQLGQFVDVCARWLNSRLGGVWLHHV